MLELVPPVNFKHAAEVRGRTKDPREDAFDESEVVIDLRNCGLVLPAAALWVLIYPLLALSKGSKCTVLVPEDDGVCVYLKSLGLFDELRAAGVELDDRDIRRRSDEHIVLPITRFGSEFEVETAANLALDRLLASRVGSSNTYHEVVSEIFVELGNNAVEHSGSPVGAFGFIQFSETKKGSRFVCAVADGGIGIRKSLERNPELRPRIFYDWDAIELALGERISGTGSKTKGIGLFGLAEDMRYPNRMFLLHSGKGSVQVTEEVETRARRTKLFPGTLAYASIPT